MYVYENEGTLLVSYHTASFRADDPFESTHGQQEPCIDLETKKWHLLVVVEALFCIITACTAVFLKNVLAGRTPLLCG